MSDKVKKNVLMGFLFLVLLIIFVICYFAFFGKSSDNSLKELTIIGHSIDFKPEEYAYVLKVENSVDNLEFIIDSTDKNAKVSVSDTHLKEGANEIVITVEAENGKTQNYRIYVQRKPLELKCPDGYSLVDNMCEIIEKVSVAKLSYSCSNGGELKNNECIFYEYDYPKVSYSCSSGYTLEGNKCSKTISKDATPNYFCDTGYKLKGNLCYRYPNYKPTIKYSCPSNNYDLIGSSCVYDYVVSAQPVNGRYICTDSSCYLSGSSCICSRSISAQKSASCMDGYKYDGYECVSVGVTPQKVIYSCSSDYELSGNKCKKEEVVSANSKYSCPSGYSKTSDNSCKKVSKKVPADYNYSCGDGLILNEDNNCYKKTIVEPTK